MLGENIYFAFEIVGTIAFAISGAMVAIQKKMDILGVIILGVTTAIGGGIVRDVLIGRIPPRSLEDPLFAIVSIVVSVIVFLPFIKDKINTDNMVFVIIDALGLGTFTVVGVETALGFDNVFFQIFMGVLTGVGGGVMRDVFAAEMPTIFVKRFYAVASLIGAIVCAVMCNFSLSTKGFAMVVGIVVTVVLRVLAAKYKWNLPRA